MPLIFKGNEETAYRDPTAFFFNNKCYLFYTLSLKRDGYMFNHIAVSESADLIHWTNPRILTSTDRYLNYSSPGNIIGTEDGYLLCFCSYPMPETLDKMTCADGTARLFYMKTTDFVNFSSPERIYPKGRDCPFEKEGRMIDPYILHVSDMYYLYYKADGISFSSSVDLVNWNYLGRRSGGENVCVIDYKGGFRMLHSPADGIGIMDSSDSLNWVDKGMLDIDKKALGIADGRLTAGFALPHELNGGKGWLLFFHQSKKDSYPETHGSASLVCVFTEDFSRFVFDFEGLND
ncbi:MAG: hypothetical protein J5850_04375 [Clostridia bacterium]|nr:hypothetical protein [Clostridia bacterium]